MTKNRKYQDCSAKHLANAKDMLTYSPREGIFRWKNCKTRPYGTLAGATSPTGRVRIMVNGKMFHASHLAWWWVYGRLPTKLIDHINRNPRDNRIANLRECDHAMNAANSIKTNKTGYRGVTKIGNRFWAQITVRKKKILLGTFRNATDAARAYDAAAQRSYGEFAVLNFSNRRTL